VILSTTQILKLLDNEDMDPSELERIRDDVDYYIEVLFESLFFVISICHEFYISRTW
jgi:CCR4-NOT transcriptional regulation complex NOT5 subunit